MVTVDHVREVALALPRTTEGRVRGQLRFRVGQIVYVGFGRDESIMGFGFPREERDALVEGDPERFLLPPPSLLRYRWVLVRLDAIDHDELTELVQDAWRMVVPRRVADDHLGPA